MPTRVLSPSFLFGELPSGYLFLAPRSKKREARKSQEFPLRQGGP